MKRKPNTFEEIMCLTGVIIVTGILWQYLELLIYGELQHRQVDDIMVIVWILFVVGAYIYGQHVGTAEKEVPPTYQQTGVKLHVFRNKDGVWFVMESEVDGQRIGLAAAFPEETADRIAAYLSKKGG